MSTVYYWTGFTVIWGLACGLGAGLTYLMPWRFIGYLVGWFRLARLSNVSPWRWFMIRWAWKHTIGLEDGWFQEREVGNVPLYGFAKIKERKHYAD